MGNPSERLLSQRDLTERLRLSRTTIYRLVRLGTFPKPIKITETLVRWRESDVLAWLDRRAATA